jgi:hypothetical protein
MSNALPSIAGNCIIEDQGDHLIVALKIPKATIQDNLPLFGALAYYAGAPDGALGYYPTRLKGKDVEQGVWSTRADPPSA